MKFHGFWRIQPAPLLKQCSADTYSSTSILLRKTLVEILCYGKLSVDDSCSVKYLFCVGSKYVAEKVQGAIKTVEQTHFCLSRTFICFP